MFSCPVDVPHHWGPAALGEACHRGGSGHPGNFCFNLLPHWSAALYRHLPNHFSFSLYKKTTKSWLIISNSVHPIMIQWIIYFSKLNHSRSHFLPCRQKPLYFTHGSQLVFIEVFKIYLNTETFKKSCFIFLSQLLSWYHFVLVFKNFSFEGRETTCPYYDCALSLGKEALGFIMKLISLLNIFMFFLFVTIFVSIYIHECHILAQGDFRK